MVGVARVPEAYFSSNPVRTGVIGIKMPKFRPWHEALSNDIRNRVTQGIDNKMNIRNVPQSKIEPAELEPISLGQLATLFIMYLAGTLVAVIAFLIERVVGLQHL